MSDLSAKKRRELKESDFGIPEKRLYPMIDAEDVTSAVSLFGKASPKYRKTLAKRILSKAKEFNVDSSGWKTIIQCAQEQVPPMSDGTSIGNTPPLTIDTFNETSKNVFTSGDFENYKKEDLTENRGPIPSDDVEDVQEAAVGASLLTLKNQLQRMVGNAFKFIGGSLVPKFTMQSNEKPEVSFDVNAVGQNVEVTPKYNGTPDTMHKRKGIAFMSAANTIADFVESIVSKYKPAMATEYVQDELFTRVQMLVGESASNDDFFPKRKL